MTRLSSAERAFGAVMLLGGLAHLVVAVALVWASGGAVVSGLGPAGWGAVAVAGLLAGISPRRHRPFALPVLVGLALELLLRLLQPGGEGGAAALGLGAVAADLGLSAGTFAAAVKAANGHWLRGGPPG